MSGMAGFHGACVLGASVIVLSPQALTAPQQAGSLQIALPAVQEVHGLPGVRSAYRGGDVDGDSVLDAVDNCMEISNFDQLDTDNDGYGNRCDPDLNNDAVVNFLDLGVFKAALFSLPSSQNWNPDADFDGNLQINFADLALLREYFFAAPGPSGLPCAGSVPCEPDNSLHWPISGQAGSDWVVQNYVDLDPGAGLLDYAGGDKTTDGHTGVDIDVPNFRAMDADVPVLAAAAGIVLDINDDHYDRHMACNGPWNYVRLGHANGETTLYGHLKKNSVTLTTGDAVLAGDVLGVVGSSGCSARPHLHFEVRDAFDQLVSPFAAQRWVAPPAYDTPLTVMDIALYDGVIFEYQEVVDPPPNITLIPPDHRLGVGQVFSGGEAGDFYRLRIVDPGGTEVQSVTTTLTATLRHSFWVWNGTIPAASAPGIYALEVEINGALARSYAFNVGPFPSDYQRVRVNQPIADYQDYFNDQVASGRRLVWIDGFDVNGSTYVNTIFDKSPSGRWFAAHNLTSGQFQSTLDDLTADGYRLVHIDAYRYLGDIRWAVIYLQQGGAELKVYLNASEAGHISNQSDFVSQGYYPVNLSTVQDSNGNPRYTSLYSKRYIGSWATEINLDSGAFQARFDDLSGQQGLQLVYMEANNVLGEPRFNGIWSSTGPTGWVATYNIDALQFQDTQTFWHEFGLITRFVTGYNNGFGTANFAGMFSN